jgi:hypothetical protein
MTEKIGFDSRGRSAYPIPDLGIPVLGWRSPTLRMTSNALQLSSRNCQTEAEKE